MAKCTGRRCPMQAGYKVDECNHKECQYRTEPITNAQKIRSMSNEELSWFLMLWSCEAVAKHNGVSSENPDTQKSILNWLQKPAE